METFDLFGHVDESLEPPVEGATEAVKKAYRLASKKAWTQICLDVEPENQFHVRDTHTTKEAWDALKSQFACESILQKVRLRHQYYSCRLQSGGNMLEHINNLRSLHDQLKEMGVNIDDKELTMTVLASLPEEFKPLITALDAVGEDNISFEKVNNLEAVETKKRNQRKRSVELAISAKNKDISRETVQNERHKRIAIKQKGKENNPFIVQKIRKGDDVANPEALIASDDDNKSGWIIYSGATQHMTFEETPRPCKVNPGDNCSILAYGKGTYNLVADLNGHNQNIVICEVLFIPDLEKNLSVRAMVKLGASVGFKGDLCKVMRNSKLLAMGERCGKLYMLNVIPGKEYINVAKEETDMHLWHCWFGHFGVDDVSQLANNNVVDGMNDVGDNGVSPCESCIMGKQH
ncbi:Hypothetical predicted protein [Paramuricea clavata]|uniref:Uncharacterized protein n=1 Tax=Paramuricea clavata TaxID=317549 RepID=A0A6S7FQ85_PARCT|nr:Hypothetical predicted protein [Paramuricea clavata]